MKKLRQTCAQNGPHEVVIYIGSGYNRVYAYLKWGDALELMRDLTMVLAEMEAPKSDANGDTE